MATFDLSQFSLGDMLRCGIALRRLAADSATMEDAASGVVSYFYMHAADAGTGRRQCALVRFYKTHPYGALEPDQQHFARGLLGASASAPAPSDEMRCLTLLATAGDRPEWNSRHQSRGHKAIPLPSAQIVERAPMVAQLIKQFGLELGAVVSPTPEVVRELEGKSYNVFHVEHAAGSPFIPAQAEFVVPERIRSVVGFGGSLRDGNLFAVILFSRVHIPAAAASRFRNIALDVKASIFSFAGDRIFAPPSGPPPQQRVRADRAGA